MQDFDIAVVGAGLAGSLAALALSKKGYRVALIGPSSSADGRTTALMQHSINLLRDLDLWAGLEPWTAPLQTMRIIDGTARLLRSPPVTFHAAEIGLDAFGHNIPNAPFLTILDEALSGMGTVERFTQPLETVAIDTQGAALTLRDGTRLQARLVVAADGRRSTVRSAINIGVRNWSYPQSALVLNFSHSLPHDNISTEFHTEAGPFTQVPLPGNRSSLVWVCKPEDAEHRCALSLDVLSGLVEQRMQSTLGTVTVESAPQAFPLSGMTAAQFGKGCVALVGEAGHAFPPIGAQGLNLSLRDIMTILSLLDNHSPANELVIPASFGESYDRKRRADVISRTASVDLLNRSLLSDFLPVQMLRAAGLHVLSAVAPLRNIVMREGLTPGSALKTLAETVRERFGRKSA